MPSPISPIISSIIVAKAASSSITVQKEFCDEVHMGARLHFWTMWWLPGSLWKQYHKVWKGYPIWHEWMWSSPNQLTKQNSSKKLNPYQVDVDNNKKLYIVYKGSSSLLLHQSKGGMGPHSCSIVIQCYYLFIYLFKDIIYVKIIMYFSFQIEFIFCVLKSLYVGYLKSYYYSLESIHVILDNFYRIQNTTLSMHQHCTYFEGINGHSNGGCHLISNKKILKRRRVP